MKIDYHTHHVRCGHAVGTLEQYIESAIAQGMVQIGLSDHMPLLHVDPASYYPEMAMPMDELPRYVEECLKLKEKYRDRISVRVGLEGDYIEGHEDEIAKIIEAYPWDYVIGSVHFLGTWDVTDFRQVHNWEGRNIFQVYEQYYGAVRKAAAAGLYDYIGHIDAIKRFGYRPEEDTAELEESALQAVAKHGLAIELNAAGIHTAAKEMYPSPRILKRARELGIPVTYGSDAHHPDRVGQKAEEAERILRSSGINEIATFEGRLRGRIPL
ncbi:histidinol-phosphatase HisJ [Cohnella sp. CFH 77786]|uniref:histidinol-phosphatase HisJ n=1 Tax=Cohnella sp. CFH 77786 TaxID=2662265 RepID=UPI001C609FF2|nr:histidinol-phosphatase HisJ [Cohnella sp. CFH 77786]MBW5448984.1 histidinol-phosphatase HisJ [Cohnella sp. CFH 77786]